MPTAAEILVDTSVAVPLVVADHRDHDAVREALAGRRLGLSGHAAFETFSVLTRLPAPARRPPTVVQSLLETSFPATRYLGADAARQLVGRLGTIGIAGGAVYDALVAGAAREHGAQLATRDSRAVATYRALGVDLMLL